MAHSNHSSVRYKVHKPHAHAPPCLITNGQDKCLRRASNTETTWNKPSYFTHRKKKLRLLRDKGIYFTYEARITYLLSKISEKALFNIKKMTAEMKHRTGKKSYEIF